MKYLLAVLIATVFAEAAFAEKSEVPPAVAKYQRLADLYRWKVSMVHMGRGEINDLMETNLALYRAADDAGIFAARRRYSFRTEEIICLAQNAGMDRKNLSKLTIGAEQAAMTVHWTRNAWYRKDRGGENIVRIPTYSSEIKNRGFR